MTFPAELERLLKIDTHTPQSAYLLERLLVNHADAILGLVRAAEKVRHWHDAHNGGMIVSAESVHELWEALAKLNGEGK